MSLQAWPHYGGFWEGMDAIRHCPSLCYNVAANQSAVRWITLSAIVWSSLNTP